MIGDDELGDIFLEPEEEVVEEIVDQDADSGNDDAEPANAEADADNQGDGNDAAAKPKRKVVRNPQLKLDPVRLCGNRGISVLPDAFKNVTLQGRGKEREDVNKIIKVLEHWGHRLYPKLRFDDLLDKIETLGKKKPVQVFVKKIRLDMPLNIDDEIIEPNENGQDVDLPMDNDALFDTLHDGVNDPEPVNLFPNSPVFDNTTEIC